MEGRELFLFVYSIFGGGESGFWVLRRVVSYLFFDSHFIYLDV